MPSRKPFWVDFLLFLLVLIPAGAQRIIAPYPIVFGAPEIGFSSPDPWYHVRHAEYATHHFPHLLKYDAATYYPTGEIAEHAGFFDLSAAGFARLLYGPHASAEQVGRVAAISPVVWGVLGFFILFFFARFLGTYGSVWAWIFFLSPGMSLQPSLLGEFDHHVAEMTLLPLCSWLLLIALRPEATRSHAFLSGLGLTLFMFTWAGAPMILGFMVGVVWLYLGIDLLLHQPVTINHQKLALHFLCTAVTTAVIGTVMVDWRMKVVFFWPSVAGLCLFALGVLLARTKKRFVLITLLVLVSVGLAVYLSDWVAWWVRLVFTKKALTVQEHRFARLDTILTWNRVTAPLALLTAPLLFLEIRERRAAFEWLVVPIVGIGIIVLWLVTRDYIYHVSIWFCLLASLAIEWLGRQLSTVDAFGPKARFAPQALVGAMIVGVALKWLPSPAFKSSEIILAFHQGWREALGWFRTSSPPYARPVTESPAPFGRDYRFPDDHYGVMVAWDFGHLMSYLGRRTPVVSGTPDRDRGYFFVTRGEKESLARICPKCQGSERVRFVVIDDNTAGIAWRNRIVEAGRTVEEPTKPMGTCTLPDGSSREVYGYGPQFEESVVNGLYFEDGRNYPHYRLAYESPTLRVMAYVMTEREGPKVPTLQAVPFDAQSRALLFENSVPVPGGCLYGARATSAIKVFEIVKGATIVGTTRPGTPVTARVSVEATTTNRTFVIERSAQAKEDGSFELVLAYPTEPVAWLGVRSQGRWVLTASTATASVDVSELDVQGGVRKEVSF